ncbi:MAG: filamentation induced by cAMP protein fic, partial [Bacteroidetes bacterium]|nr:filamentation induced by cAMP protein fic [Fibrella sp.]
MKVNPADATLPQLLDRYRTASAGVEEGTLDDLTLHTYHSM